jgi:hypothetical protein
VVNAELYRAGIVNKRVEPLAGLNATHGGGGDWIGVAPDGSPLILSDTRIEEIYALDMEWH